MHIAVLLWGFTGVLGRAINLSEYPLVCYRMLLTTLILITILYFRKQWKILSWAEAKILFGIGCIIAIHWVAFYGSIKYANASIALICLSTAGIYTALLEPLIFKRKVQLSDIIFSLIAFAGMMLIYKVELHFNKGIWFGLIAAMLSAVFTLMNKKVINKYESQLVAAYEIGGGLILLILLFPLYNLVFVQTKFIPSTADFGYLIILAYFCTVLGQSLALSALKKLSPFTVILSVNLEPVYGIALAAYFYNENTELNPNTIWGILLIALSVLGHMAFMLWKKKRTLALNS
jgi:drug/metabolite transporter (DMT)-like permease